MPFVCYLSPSSTHPRPLHPNAAAAPLKSPFTYSQSTPRPLAEVGWVIGQRFISLHIRCMELLSRTLSIIYDVVSKDFEHWISWTTVITKAKLAALNGDNKALILYVQAGYVPGESMQFFTYLRR